MGAGAGTGAASQKKHVHGSARDGALCIGDDDGGTMLLLHGLRGGESSAGSGREGDQRVRPTIEIKLWRADLITSVLELDVAGKVAFPPDRLDAFKQLYSGGEWGGVRGGGQWCQRWGVSGVRWGAGSGVRGGGRAVVSEVGGQWCQRWGGSGVRGGGAVVSEVGGQWYQRWGGSGVRGGGAVVSEVPRPG